MVKIRESLIELFSKDNVAIVKTGSESGKAVIEVGKAIQEKKDTLQAIQPYLEQISSLLDVLDSPWPQVVKDMIPFAPVAIALLKLACEHLKRELSLEECIMIVVQAAYMESWQAEFKGNPDRFQGIDLDKQSKQIDRNFQKLRELEIDRAGAEQIITALPSSQLIKEFNAILVDRLKECGVDPIKARNFADRVAMGTPRYVNQMVAENAKKIKVLAEIYRNGGEKVILHYASIDEYLTEKIAPLPLQPVFGESDLQLKDIYIPLEIQPLKTSGEKTSQSPYSIDEWAIEKLLDPQSKAILFIQGEAGRGKSVFCRMFADLVRRELAFTPILIRLREILTLGDTLTETLEQHLEGFDFSQDKGWLTNKNQRFLFLFDGFDELILQGKSGGLKEFIEQVEKFQHDSHHRILITGRPLAMQGIEKAAFRNKCLERVSFLPMNNQIRLDWFSKWRDKFGQEEIEAFVEFLNKCPVDIWDKLAREPLLLYVLARIHLDGAITVADLIGTSGMGAKVKVYDRTIAWVLEKQREDLNQKMFDDKLEVDELRQLLTEVAVCVIQSGNEIAKVTTIEHRLSKDSDRNIKELFNKIRATATDEKKAMNNLLTTFYIQPAQIDRDGSVEFAHKSFGEFLFAERIKKAICDWSSVTITRKGKAEDRIKQAELEWQIYDLLGSSCLTPDIVDCLREMLHTSTDWQPRLLFDRLNEFWENWCTGEFIDRPIDNLPQKKMNILGLQMPDRKLRLGIRHVDVFTGLNILILLLELHRYTQSRDELKDTVFYPNGKSESVDITRLMRIIHYTDSIEIAIFARNIGVFLSGANLSGANLSGAYLSRTNLRNANLSNTNLSRAKLSGANLRGANFSGAYLSRANFSGADLSGANFSGADLSGANLSSADLSGADLSGAYLSRAYLSGANFFGADLTSAYLSRTDLSDANLSGADLTSAYLSRANLSGVYLIGADLSGANLGDANLSGADLSDANLNGAKLRDTYLSDANLHHSNLSSANLSGADLSGADLSDVQWDNLTNLQEVKGIATADLSAALKQHIDLQNSSS